VIKNKFVILSFLLFAWTIIFAHSIVPHNHHSENLITECNYDHIHGRELFDITEIHDCDHECTDNACHFNVDILTRISLDNIFDLNSDNNFFDHISFLEINTTSFYIEFVFEQVPKSNYLRGPPQIS
jgi:hypothetical protein